MKRHFEPGRWSSTGCAVRIDTHRAATCCTGECNQGRRCPLVVDRISPLAGTPRAPIHQQPVIGALLQPGQVIPIRPAITFHRAPAWRRLRRAWRALFDHIRAPLWGR